MQGERYLYICTIDFLLSAQALKVNSEKYILNKNIFCVWSWITLRSIIAERCQFPWSYAIKCLLQWRY